MRKKKISLPVWKSRLMRLLSPQVLFSSGRRASLSAVRKASMTVEAAAALPLFFLAVVSLICMMDLYGSYAQRVVKLQEQAETAASWAGAAGDYAPGFIDLPLGFTYQPQWYPAALPGIRLAVRGRVHTWTGRDASDTVPEETEREELVYVTEHESVYHTSSSCTHLSLSVHAVGGGEVDHLRNEDGSRYHACEKCVGSGGHNGTVYITREGDCYHNNAQCSGLTRSVRLVKKTAVDSLPLCSRCAQQAASS